MIPAEFGLAIGNSGPVRHAVGNNRTVGGTAFRVSAASRGSADQKSLFAAATSHAPALRSTSCCASSHCALRSWNFGLKGSLTGGGLPGFASSMEARSNEHASDRPERRPPPASLSRGSGFAGDPAQSPRSAGNVPGCRSVTSAGRSPTSGFPAARGTDRRSRVLRDRRRPGIGGSLASCGTTRLGPMSQPPQEPRLAGPAAPELRRAIESWWRPAPRVKSSATARSAGGGLTSWPSRP
jgi:hypothetical protein